jgi:hypothetical protein
VSCYVSVEYYWSHCAVPWSDFCRLSPAASGFLLSGAANKKQGNLSSGLLIGLSARENCVEIIHIESVKLNYFNIKLEELLKNINTINGFYLPKPVKPYLKSTSECQRKLCRNNSY